MKNKRIVGLLIILLLLTVFNVGAASEQQQEFELTADELLIDDAQAEITATGNVKFSRGEIKLSANKLIAQQNLNQIQADGAVVMEQAAGTLRGEHLNLNSQTELATLTGNPSYKSEELSISGKKFEFDFKTGQLVVNQQVYLENKAENVTAEADQLQYDREEAEAILTGDVLAQKGGRRINADKMIIDLETNKIKAEGKTKLVVPNATEKQGDINGD
jgi:lipopolysaccharide transport protein LptA